MPIVDSPFCTSENGCPSCPVFVCATCRRPRPWCVGADDILPDSCDDCFLAMVMTGDLDRLIAELEAP